MKPIIKNFLAFFIGTIVTVAIFAVINWCNDKNEERQKAKPLKEKVLTLLDDNEIDYQKRDFDSYAFTYNDVNYLCVFESDDPKYIQIICIVEMDGISNRTLLKIANEREIDQKCVKILVLDNNTIFFAIQQFIEPNCDIDEAFFRWLSMLKMSMHDYVYELRKYLS